MDRKHARAGYNVYGQTIGVLILETSFPRIPGSIGNLSTFPFPVVHKVIKGSNVSNIILEPDLSLVKPFIDGAKELEKEGVKGITTSCGFLGMFQREVADAVHIPVFCSSLLQVPMAARMLKKDQKVGIMTADSRNLTEKNLRPMGIDDSIKVSISGMEKAPEFWGVFFEDKPEMDIKKMESEAVEVALSMVKRESIGAMVLDAVPFRLSRRRFKGRPGYQSSIL